MKFLYSVNDEKFYYLDGEKKICLNKEQHQVRIDFEEFYEFGEFSGNTEETIKKLYCRSR